MPDQYGVLKIIPAKEVKRPGWWPDAATALRFMQMWTIARAGDRSSSEDWPKITKCFQRNPTTIVIDAQATGFAASISFGVGGQTQEHSYRLHEAPRGIEIGKVENVLVLTDSPFNELPYSLLDACPLEAYPHKFVVFTRADDHLRTALWLVGVSGFSAVLESVSIEVKTKPEEND